MEPKLITKTTFDPEALVADFMQKFELPRDPDLWLKLVHEELHEAEEALAHLLKELSDVIYVLCGLKLSGAQQGTLDASTANRLFRLLRAADALEDTYQGIIDKAFVSVHESNMSKLGDDGKPIRREDGKVLKGPNYKEPDMLKVLMEYSVES